MSKRSARNIKVAELIANPTNIRAGVGDVTELARSIRENGILNPLLVTEDPIHRGWLLLAGHRRLAASQQAGLAVVPCFIHHDVGSDAVEQTVVMLVENVQRKNLTPVEKARAYGRLRDVHGLTVSQIARRTGIHASTISTHLALLDIGDESLELVEAGEVNAGDAIAVVREKRKEDRQTNGTPVRGRPVLEPPHFTSLHPLADVVRRMCTHTRRPRIHGSQGVGCGQCWEIAIREEQRQGPPEPSRAEPSRAEPRPTSTTKPSSCDVSTATGVSA